MPKSKRRCRMHALCEAVLSRKVRHEYSAGLTELLYSSLCGLPRLDFYQAAHPVDHMSGSSFSGTGGGQPPSLDQRDSAGCTPSHSGSRFERTDDANYSGTQSFTEIHRADAQQCTTREARRSAGKTKLTTSDHSEKDDDRPRTPDRPAKPHTSRPTSTKLNISAPRIAARHSAPLGLTADNMRIPWDRYDVQKAALSYNRESRSHNCRAEVEESSESEAEAIAVRHSIWVKYVMPSAWSSPENDERGQRDDSCGSSSLLESTRSRCVDSIDGVEHASYAGRTEGSNLQRLNITRHLNLTDLIGATSWQLQRAGNTERRWTASEFGDDRPRPESREKKVAVWDPCRRRRALV
ncbi:hypothetical protein HPB52_013562 [Rhipicephalus sanguineus]|uniref:Uncharacterized protein n=1 Tax=Rhipicephalus sanguineus TaxID=34632 RepID=A0A9D4PW66_RHISA|nr:hypothetical protein HPB52_013562 [Rhipicephalus sanguineus]